MGLFPSAKTVAVLTQLCKSPITQICVIHYREQPTKGEPLPEASEEKELDRDRKVYTT